MEILIKLWMTWLTFSFQIWLMHLGINDLSLFQDDPCFHVMERNWSLEVILLYPGLNGWLKRDQTHGECESWYEARHLGLQYRTSRKCKMASLFGFGKDSSLFRQDFPRFGGGSDSIYVQRRSLHIARTLSKLTEGLSQEAQLLTGFGKWQNTRQNKTRPHQFCRTILGVASFVREVPR